jgi:acyl carrier protein
MTRQEFLSSLDGLLELPRGTLKGPENLCDLEQWTSLTVIGFIALVDSNNLASVSPRQLTFCRTVSDLLRIAKIDSEATVEQAL